MSRVIVNTSVLGDMSWWQWVVTVPLLYLHVVGLGVPWSIYSVIGLCVLMTCYYGMRLRGLRPYPVQIRLGYVFLLLVGLVPGLGWVHWVQLFGASAMVVVGYCPMGRLLGLAWWNRGEPMSFSLIRRVVFAPLCGGLFEFSGSGGEPISSMSCSLARRS